MKTLRKSSGKLAFVLLFSLSIFFVACEKDETTDTNNPTGTNTAIQAPVFDLKNLSGETIRLADYKNKVLVLFFFGNSCPSCKAAAPDIQKRLQDGFGANPNFALLGLDQWDGNAAAVQSFKNSTGVTFPLLLMASQVAKDYSTTYDRLVVIDKSGKIVFSGKQLAGTDLNAVKVEVEELLK